MVNVGYSSFVCFSNLYYCKNYRCPEPKIGHRLNLAGTGESVTPIQLLPNLGPMFSPL